MVFKYIRLAVAVNLWLLSDSVFNYLQNIFPFLKKQNRISCFDKSFHTQPWRFIKIKPTQLTFTSWLIYYNLQCSSLFGEKLKNHRKTFTKGKSFKMFKANVQSSPRQPFWRVTFQKKNSNRLANVSANHLKNL